MFSSNNHWRNTARPVRFFVVDYRAGVFVFIFLMHMRLWTLGLLIFMMLLLWAVEKRGLSMPVAMRRVRLWFVGPYRPALGKVHHRDFHDYG